MQNRVFVIDNHKQPLMPCQKEKRAEGFQTGEMVIAVVKKGKKKGVYEGRVAIRSSGNFNIKTASETVQGISYRCCKLVQRQDGYMYAHCVSSLSQRTGSPHPLRHA